MAFGTEKVPDPGEVQTTDGRCEDYVPGIVTFDGYD
jgi:hypothetical protein